MTHLKRKHSTVNHDCSIPSIRALLTKSDELREGEAMVRDLRMDVARAKEDAIQYLVDNGQYEALQINMAKLRKIY